MHNSLKFSWLLLVSVYYLSKIFFFNLFFFCDGCDDVYLLPHHIWYISTPYFVFFEPGLRYSSIRCLVSSSFNRAQVLFDFVEKYYGIVKPGFQKIVVRREHRSFWLVSILAASYLSKYVCAYSFSMRDVGRAPQGPDIGKQFFLLHFLNNIIFQLGELQLGPSC